MHKQLKKQFEAMDQSGDGSLSKEELVNFLFDKVKG
jgi:Ca2+-binding EF-hand superfamily protein